MKTVMLGFALASALAGAAHADAPPSWCSTPGIERHGRLDGDVKTALDPSNPKDATLAIVRETCFPDAEGQARAKEVAKARAMWSKRLDLGDKEWAELGLWGSGSVSEVSSLRLVEDKKYGYVGIDPMDQFVGLRNGFKLGSDSLRRSVYFLDALGPAASEAGRLAYILQCMGSDSEVDWAMCAPDIARLDKRKVLAEAKASQASPSAKTLVRFEVDDIDAKLAVHAKRVKDLIAKDATYGKMFEIAETTRKQWETTTWQAEAAVLAMTLQMDDARARDSRKAFEGCDDKAWSLWQGEIAKFPPSTFEGVPIEQVGATNFPTPALAALITTPGSYNAAIALYTCITKNDPNRPNDGIIATLGSVLETFPGLRGPRSATHLAIRNAGLQLDERSAYIKWPLWNLEEYFKGQGVGGPLGTVAKVETKGTAPEGVAGPVVTITFAKKSEKREECTSSKALNKIAYITGNGDVVYQTRCLKFEMVTIDKTPDPEVVTARSAKGLAAGMTAYVAHGEVFAVWPKGSKLPTMFAGVPLKK